MRLSDRFPEIDLRDIILRELSEKDAPYYYKYLSDPLANKFLSDNDIPKNISEAKIELEYWQSLFKNGSSIYWGIAKKSNNELIGTCGFNSWSIIHERVEISYDLSRKYWRKGIMTRSLRAICDFSFIRMNIKRIQATVVHENIASIKLLEKLGFSTEGNLRFYCKLRGVSKNSYMYSLLYSDIVF